MRDEWKLPFVRIENRIGILLIVLIPLWLTIVSWQTSLWLVPLASVGGWVVTRRAVWLVEVILVDFLFESPDEFHHLAWQVENEIFGWTHPYKKVD
jgi:hypothetical protein